MNIPIGRVCLCAALFSALPAFGQVFAPINSPTTAYTSATTVIPIVGADNTTVGSISGGGQTLTLSTSLTLHTVPGGGWSTWSTPPNSESATPRVIGTYAALTSETITLSTPQVTFGFELEPDTFAAFNITVTFFNGGTTLGAITRNINGSAGARLFAASSAVPITSVVITAPAGANGFAIAQLRFGATPLGISSSVSVPALGLPAMTALGMLLMAVGSLLARRQLLSRE